MDSGICYSKQFGQKTFSGESVKDAYMKAAKWYASNIIAKDKLHEVQVEFVKGTNQVTIKLFAVLPEQVIRDRHCAICREVHHSFFINEANNCNVCDAGAYQRRMAETMSIKYNYYKELFSKVEGNE